MRTHKKAVVYFLCLFFFPAFFPIISYSHETLLCSKVDGLKIRVSPSLNADTLAFLYEGEPVIFLGTKSSNTVIATLRKKTTTNIFLFIQTRNGKQGWVFADGLINPVVSGTPDIQAEHLQGRVLFCKKKEKYPEDNLELVREDKYDLLGRRIYYAYYWGGEAPAFETSLRYTSQGKIINSSTLTAKYNTQGYLVFLKEKIPDKDASIPSDQELEYQYFYDAAGRLSEKRISGMMSWESTIFVYDAEGKLIKKTWSCSSDVAGEEEEVTVYHYDKNGRLHTGTQTYKCSMSSVINLYQIRYDLDKNGNIIHSIKKEKDGSISGEYYYEYGYFETDDR